MLWLIITILAYFLLALAALGDKYLLTGPPNPKVYSFYVGLLSILVLLLIPFVDFILPDLWIILLSLLAGAVFIFALYGFFQGLEHFEASRVVPAIGGLVPLFTFGLVSFFARGEVSLSAWQLLSFVSLLFGTFLITFETKPERAGISLWLVFKKKNTPFPESLKISVVAAFLFSLSFVLAKQVYEQVPFWPGFIWMRIGCFLTALGFLATPEVRREIFSRQKSFKKKTSIIFIINQALGGGASILQNWAIALVPLGLLPFVNALEGTKYAFVFILAVLLSFKFPQLLAEKVSRKIIIQKSLAIILIGLGLAILAFQG